MSALSFFYDRIFPFELIHKWLTSGGQEFSNRELSMAVKKPEGDEMYIRWLSFAGAKELRHKMANMNLMAHKIDIGGVYTFPVSEKDLHGALFAPVEREVVLDIDMDDYDEIRTCCKGKEVCGKCWLFIRLAIKLLDRALRDDFGFRSIVWVFSGRRGVHCWVSDRAARQLSVESRSALIEYLSLVKGSDRQKKKVQLFPSQSTHPMIRRAFKTCMEYFPRLAAEQDFFRRGKPGELPVEAYIPPKKAGDFKRFVEKEAWDGSSEAYWDILQKFFRPSQELPIEPLMEIVLSHSYPRLDVNVSKDLQHLLKSPFCVHEATGKVCVPIPPSMVDSFDPTTAPTIAGLRADPSVLHPFLEFFEEATQPPKGESSETAGCTPMEDW